MSRLARAGLDGTAMPPMGAGQPEAGGIGGRQNQRDVMGQHATGPDRDAKTPAGFGQPIAIERIVGVFEKDALAAIAPMDDGMRQPWHNDASDAGHGQTAAEDGYLVKTDVPR